MNMQQSETLTLSIHLRVHSSASQQKFKGSPMKLCISYVGLGQWSSKAIASGKPTTPLCLQANGQVG